MSIEKIERVREVMSWLDGWDDKRSAASFKGFQSITLGDIRAILDELSRLREALKPFAKVGRSIRGRSVEYTIRGDGYDLDAPLVDANDFAAAARALSDREGQE